MMPSETPERIWIERPNMGRQTWRSHNAYGGTEYVRADLHEDLAARVVALEAVATLALDEWETWVRDQLEGTGHFAPAMADITAARAELHPAPVSAKGE